MGFLSDIVPTAIGTVIGGPVGAIAGGLYTSGEKQQEAAEEAARIQAGAAEKGIEFQQAELEQARKFATPYIGAGHLAVKQMKELLGLQPTAAPAPAPAGATTAMTLQPQQATFRGDLPTLYEREATPGYAGAAVGAGELATLKPEWFRLDPYEREKLEQGQLDSVLVTPEMARISGAQPLSPQETREILDIPQPAAAPGPQDIYSQIMAGPEYQALVQQGEEALLQSAAATGGLRGGNVQRALAQFRPQILSNLIQQRFQRLGGIARLGQAAAAGQAAIGQQAAGQVGGYLGEAGAAQAGAALTPGGFETILQQGIPLATKIGTAAISGGF